MTTNPVPSLTPEVQTKIRSFQLGIIKSALLLCAFAALVLALAGFRAEARGLALGGLFGAAEFRLSGILAVRHFTGRGRSGSFLSVPLKFALLALPLVVAIGLQSVSLATTLAGIFSVKAIIYLRYVIRGQADIKNTYPLK